MVPLWRFFIEKRQFTLLVITGLVIVGGAAMLSMTRESTPEVQIPVGGVTVVLPGASPEDVERLVTNKIEEHLANLPDLHKLTSSSRESISVVVAEFNASADIQRSIQKLKDEVDKAVADLPAEAKTPVVTEVNFVDQPIQLISVSADLPPAQFAALAEEVKREIQTVKGVSRVEVSGVRDREIQVVVRKEEIARLGISLPQVVGAIAAANASLPVGSITVDDISYAVAFRGSLDTVEDIGSVAILNVGGQVIYMRDIANVSDGVQKATSYSRISVGSAPARQAMTLGVLKVRGYDITTVTKAVKGKLADLQKGILQGSDVVVSYDAGDEVQKNLSELTQTGLETVALVMLALFITIGWREAVVAGLSIPLSFLMAFIGLLYSGNTLNIVSLFSLILAIGILVDSGIVIVEAIHTRTRIYGDKRRAALEALREYAWPLMGGTIATVAFFVPLFFISGIVGKFIASIPFTLVFVLLASIFVALGLVPTIANMMAAKEESALMKRQEEYAQRAREWYASHLKAFLQDRRGQNRFLAVMLAGFIVALALPVVGILGVSFFPQADGEFLYVDMEMPQGTDLSRTDLAARAVEDKLFDDPRFSSLITTVGTLSPFSSSDGFVSADSRFANITINLVKDRAQTSTEILADVKSTLADIHIAEIRAGEPSGGPPVGAAVLIKFLGKDRTALNNTLVKARKVLEQTPGVTAVNSSNKYDSTQFVLSIDRGKLAFVGLSPAAIASTLRTAVSGVTATSLTGGEKNVDIVVSLNLNPNTTDPHESSYTSLSSLRQVPLITSTGRTVLLGSLVSESIAQSNTSITHENRERVATLTSDVLPGHSTAEVLAAFNKAFTEADMDEGVRMSVGGENEETNKSFMEMGYALIAGIVLTFVILVLAFDSFRFAGFLLLLVPLSLIGVFGGLALTLQPLSFPSVMGVIALAGVIINHAIILMDAIIQRLKRGAGKQFIDILTEAATTRLRPIFLTTITTVIGMVPLIFASGLFGPLALAILFGLSFAMILTLILIPVLVYRWPGALPPDVKR
ncbi:efflux RND transporter permease subunit [Candidatus Kaiserbacteria bacterium]|nr:efflux RND transporter permease subunit [Candidatus Kaiserbacteria bacterium]